MYENETYEGILDRVLNRIPNNLDKRESSFLYNASAPIAVELQNLYLALDNILNITFFDTSDREGKLQRCKERGIDVTQFDATSSVVVIDVKPTSISVPIGTRFNYNEINFITTDVIKAGSYHARCESTGTIGNVTGSVTPVDYINGLETAEITSIYQWGEDESNEEMIDDVYYASLNSQAFGGNRADYIEKMKKIAGVGGVKVYSAAQWQGGGTVKLVFTTSSFTKPTNEFVTSIQTIIDPVSNQGAGMGLAPIGHTVTVAGVNEVVCDVSFNLTLQSGFVWEDISEQITKAIEGYFESLNSEWDKYDNIVVRISQLETRLLGVTGVLDVSNTKINGTEDNVVIEKDSIIVRGDINATT